MNFYSSSSTNVTKLKHKQPYLFQKIMKIVRNFLTYLWFNFVFHGQILKIKNVKKIQIRRSRFNYESESEYYSSYKKSRIRIRIFGIRRKRFESESESEYSLQHCNVGISAGGGENVLSVSNVGMMEILIRE